ncbi:MAG: DUF2167 domain-containing protein [Xanthomonadales bacterium]|nr:DUF2167 domain-containing protein [Xanthomonadales bacterium]
MIQRCTRLLFAFALALLAAPAFADDSSAQADPVDQLAWQVGPVTARVGSQATLQVPKGHRFLDSANSHKLEELMHNPPSEGELYTLAPDDLHWIALLSFDAIGYVEDDEKLDADALLKSVQEGTEASNEERRKRGWGAIHATGWSFKPQYDSQSHRLEWAIIGENEQTKGQTINYNTRLLGRHGVMNVVVLADPETVTASIGEFKGLLPGYDFNDGERYAQFKAGDHVAEIGLAALITGGAAAIAAKKGLFATIGIALVKFWKLLLVGFAACGAAIKRFFSRNKS